MATLTPTPVLPRGRRAHCAIGPLDLETGGHLPEVQIAYETWGTLNAEASNAVLVLHALTGDAHVAAHTENPTPGWWEDLVGPGRALDTDRWFVVAPAILGGCAGSTGPASPVPGALGSGPADAAIRGQTADRACFSDRARFSDRACFAIPASDDDASNRWGSRFPFVTIRDMVAAEARLADELGIRRWHAVIGGSLGGARALEWAVSYPERVAGVAVIASAARSSAEQIALAQSQVQAIRLDPDYRGGDYYDGPGPVVGLGLARRIAHLSYRSPGEMEQRFGRRAQVGENPLGTAAGERLGRYSVESYLDHQAAKLTARFDANAYIAITEALMTHDVGRGRGGLTSALSRFTGRAFVAAVASDRLYLPWESQRLAALLPARPTVQYIDSPIGHDGFLVHYGQVAHRLAEALVLR